MKDKNTKLAQRATSVRGFLQSILKNKINCKKSRLELAEFLGLSHSAVEKMIYKGEGSLDAFVSSIIFAYQIDDQHFEQFLEKAFLTIKKSGPISLPDKIWYDLDSLMSQDQKLYWASLIKAAHELEQKLLSKKSQKKMAKNPKNIPIPYFSSMVAAGAPVVVDDHVKEMIDLNQELILNANSTFCVKVHGQSMINAGICDGDLLIVDSKLTPKHGQIVLAMVKGEYTVKRFIKNKKDIYLKPENSDFSSLKITKNMDFKICGVVTSFIHSC